MKDDTISRAAAIDAFLTELTKRERKNFLHTWSTVEVKYFVADMLEKLPPAQPGQRNARVFQGIVVEYPSISVYPEYEGKPYFSIKYTVNGQKFIGYGTYKPEVLSEYLKEYFMPPAQPGWIPCSTALPKDGEEVIVSIHDDSGDYACDYTSSGWYAAAGEFWVVDNEANMRVLAWMPLPTPYREGRQDDSIRTE